MEVSPRIVFLSLLLFVFSCNGDNGELRFSPDNLPQGAVDLPYSETVTVSYNATPVGEIRLSKGTLPVGLKLFHREGDNKATIHGTPEEAGMYSFTIHSWCYGTNKPGQTGNKDYSIEIVTPPQ
jgi:hypothetical protein